MHATCSLTGNKKPGGERFPSAPLAFAKARNKEGHNDSTTLFLF